MCGELWRLQRGFVQRWLGRRRATGDTNAMSARAERIAGLLRQHFAPTLLRVADESARHAGHAGAAPGGETHYRVLLVSPAFRDEARISRSRRVHEVLAGEFATGLHALELTLRTPEEHAAAKP
jgi:BolA protein